MNLLMLWKTTWKLFRKQSHSHHEIKQSHSWVQNRRTQPVCQSFVQMLTAGQLTTVKEWEPPGTYTLGNSKDMEEPHSEKHLSHINLQLQKIDTALAFRSYGTWSTY